MRQGGGDAPSAGGVSSAPAPMPPPGALLSGLTHDSRTTPASTGSVAALKWGNGRLSVASADAHMLLIRPPTGPPPVAPPPGPPPPSAGPPPPPTARPAPQELRPRDAEPAPAAAPSKPQVRDSLSFCASALAWVPAPSGCGSPRDSPAVAPQLRKTLAAGAAAARAAAPSRGHLCGQGKLPGLARRLAQPPACPSHTVTITQLAHAFLAFLVTQIPTATHVRLRHVRGWACPARRSE